MGLVESADPWLNREAVVAALSASFGHVDEFGNPCVYGYGKVPGEDGNPGVMPPVYLLVTAEPRYVGPRRAGRAGMSAWRVTVRHVGMTEREALAASSRAWAVLDGNRLTVAGEESTPLVFESGQAVAPDDDGRFSGLNIWTYAI